MGEILKSAGVEWGKPRGDNYCPPSPPKSQIFFIMKNTPAI